MLIDTHQHVFWHHRGDAGLIADLDEHGIDAAWLLSWEIPPWEDNAAYHGVLNPVHMRPDGTHAGIVLSDLLLARRNYPDRFVVGYCPHPAIGNAPALFEAAYRMHGVRVCGEWKFRLLFDDPRCLELFRAAGRLKCPVVLHLDVPYLLNDKGETTFQPLWYGGTVANLERALQACPETIFIGHAPGFWREINGDAEREPSIYPKGPIKPGGKVHQLLDRYPNLYADLSAGSARYALERDPKHATEFLIRFADRLLFARDYYGQDLWNFLKTLDLPQRVKDKLYFENALRLVPETPGVGAAAGVR
jgi:predicted TIM-barrel fold metal-dependent hydrolase